MDPVVSTLLGTLIGAAAGIAGSVWVAIISKRSEERRHLRQLAFEAGAKSWALHQDVAKRAAEMGHVRGVDPLEAYVLHSLIFSRIIEDGDLDRETILRKWREIDSIAKAVHEEIRKKEG
jgi:hypothetical protein